jgi:hypothetical protein
LLQTVCANCIIHTNRIQLSPSQEKNVKNVEKENCSEQALQRFIATKYLHQKHLKNNLIKRKLLPVLIFVHVSVQM